MGEACADSPQPGAGGQAGGPTRPGPGGTGGQGGSRPAAAFDTSGPPSPRLLPRPSQPSPALPPPPPPPLPGTSCRWFPMLPRPPPPSSAAIAVYLERSLGKGRGGGRRSRRAGSRGAVERPLAALGRAVLGAGPEQRSSASQLAEAVRCSPNSPCRSAPGEKFLLFSRNASYIPLKQCPPLTGNKVNAAYFS